MDKCPLSREANFHKNFGREIKKLQEGEKNVDKLSAALSFSVSVSAFEKK